MLAVLALPSGAQAATPGIVLNSYDRASVSRALSTGAGEVRMFVSWDALQPHGPAMDPAYIAALMSAVEQVKDGGRMVQLTFTGSPAWANGGHADPHRPPAPAHEDDFARFVASVVQRAAQQGTRLDRITVWNEPDSEHFWRPAPDIDRFAALLSRTYDAVKAADRGVQVFSGGTAGNNRDWIEGLLARAKGKFDGVAVHTDNACMTEAPSSVYRDPDGRLGRFTFVGFIEIFDVLAAHGVPGMPVLMDEMGVSSTNGGPTSCTRGDHAGKKPSGVSEARQAEILTLQYGCLANYPQIVGGTWFRLDDARDAGEEFNHYGLFHPDGSPKPSLVAFRAVVASGGGAATPCADLTPPTVRILSPTPGERFEGRVDIRASADDGGGVGLARISLFSGQALDSIRNFTRGLLDNTPVKLSPWYGSDALPVGPHTVRVSAVDKNGNVGHAAVAVEKVAPGTLRATLRARLKLPRRPLAGNCTSRRRPRRCTADFGHLALPDQSSPSIQGKVAFEWRWRNKQGRWRKLVGGLKPANKRLKATVTLPRAGRWRVRVVYRGQAPYKPLTSKNISFRAP